MYNLPAIVQAGADTAIAIGGWSGWLLAALPQGSTANLTVQMKKAMQPADPPPQLQPPANVVVETSGVRSPSDNQVTWRIRASQAGSGVMKIVLPDGTVEKRIATGGGP